MNFYAMAWDRSDTRPAGFDARYHVFDSKKGRDSWVQDSQEAEEYGEYRAATTITPELHALLRSEDGWEVMDYHYKSET